MTDIVAAFAWLFSGLNWAGPNGIPTRLLQHIEYSGLTLIIAVVIAIPLGVLIGHTGRLRGVAIAVSGGLRAIPTLGLVIVLALAVGLGLEAPLIALVILALPPILAGAYAGIEAVDPRTVDAARAQGMTELQIVTRVEIPLGITLIVGGVRSAALQVIATWTVAAFLPVGGLGRYLIDGLAVRRYDEMLGGAILVVVLALVVDGLFALAQRIVEPRGLVLARAAETGSSRSRRRSVMATAPIEPTASIE